MEFWPAGGGINNDVNRMEIGYNQFSGPIEQRNPNTARLQWIVPGGERIIISDTPFNEDGITHAVVMKIELSSAAVSDRLSLYLDPLIGIPDWLGGSGGSIAEPEFPTATVSGLDFTLGAMGTVGLFGGTGTLPVYDELRVGTTFADVVPPVEPGGTCDEPDYACFLAIAANLNRSYFIGLAREQGDVAGSDGKAGADGRVDLRDLSLWRRNRIDVVGGSGALSVARSIPEPSSCILALAAVVVWAGLARGIRS